MIFDAKHEMIRKLTRQFAETELTLEAAKELVYNAAVLKDNNMEASMACSMAKLFAAEACNEIAAKAVLVSGREFGGSDTFATSQILAAAINRIGVDGDDIIFCGRQAIDGDTAQVGPQIAEKLHIPQVSYVADIKKEGKKLTVQRMLEDDPLIELDTIGLKGSPTNVFRSFTPPARGAGMMLEGSPKEAVSQLFTILNEKHMI